MSESDDDLCLQYDNSQRRKNIAVIATEEVQESCVSFKEARTETTAAMLGSTSSLSILGPNKIDQETLAVPKSFRHGWRFGLSAGLGCAVFTCCCNIALLAISLSGAWPLGKSMDCNTVKSANTWSHVAINTLSTLLFGASNYALQILISPTRQDIDFRHAQQRPMEIGSSALSNWSIMTFKRRVLYVILFMSSLPLHLLYNSAVATTTSSVLPRVLIVSSDFEQRHPLDKMLNNGHLDLDDRFALAYGLLPDPPDYLYKPIVSDIWRDYRNGSFTKLDRHSCQDAVSSLFMSVYSVIVIQVVENSTRLGGMTLANGVTFPGPDYHFTAMTLSDPWSIEYLVRTGYDTGRPLKSRIESCSARPGQRQCSIEMVPFILGMVLACNLLKCVVLTYLLFSDTISEPILTLGDAVSSFLDCPDSFTIGQGTLCDRDIWKPSISSRTTARHLSKDHPWRPATRSYGSAIPTARWIFWLEIHLSYLIAILAIVAATSSADLAAQWRAGLGAVLQGLFFRPHAYSKSRDLFGTVVDALLVNTPQLVLSFLHLIFNNLFTVMSVSAEWSRYLQEKKRGLRVSSPAGQQRTSYWLSLPYRFSIPLLAATSGAHWLLSESIFVVGICFYDTHGQRTNDNVINGVSFLPLALLAFLGIQVIMLIWIGVFGLFEFPSGIPMVATNSWAISANCHPIRSGESLEKLRYGVIQDMGNGSYRVGLSSGEVRPLVAGEYYE